MDKHLYRVTNDKYQVEAIVLSSEYGYHVLLIDLDAAQIVPTAKHYPSLHSAKAYADQCVQW